MVLLAVGIVLAAIGVMGDHTEHHQYSWAAFYANALFFFFIALGCAVLLRPEQHHRDGMDGAGAPGVRGHFLLRAASARSR
jgi:hypothetical membrane protein